MNRKSSYGSILDILSAPNQFNGYQSRKWFKALKMEDYYLIEWYLKSGIKLHSYTHVLNPKISTNQSYRDWAVRQRGEWIEEHWYHYAD